MVGYLNMVGLLLCIIGGFMVHGGLGVLVIGVILAIQRD